MGPTDEVEGDDVAMARYRPHEKGGPLHVINVTLNETVGGRSQIEDRDRKGLSLAVGPAGVSVGVSSHALWHEDGRTTGLRPQCPDVKNPASVGERRIWRGDGVVEPKALTLSQWTAISGTAIAPGLGARTSLGLSILLGIGNVRLGYWWDSAASGRDDATLRPGMWLRRLIARAFPVQSALLRELLGRFHGPHQRLWFLTDGGRFENTGCYELLRRRVPLIVVCDGGADPPYAFEDVANLVRKARLDFGAEIEMLTPPETGVCGTIADVRRHRPAFAWKADERDRPVNLGMPLSRSHLMLAKVTYPVVRDGDERHSLLVIVKPSITGDEPLDVLQYAASHPAFPQETTADQFFDEAQWESYRRLGEHIGDEVRKLNLEKLFEMYTADPRASRKFG
jgi:hypothetical protein